MTANVDKPYVLKLRAVMEAGLFIKRATALKHSKLCVFDAVLLIRRSTFKILIIDSRII